MRLVFDIRTTQDAFARRGVGRYTDALLRGLVASRADEIVGELILLGSWPEATFREWAGATDLGGHHAMSRYLRTPTLAPALALLSREWFGRAIEPRLSALQPALFLQPYAPYGVSRVLPTVVMVHDLIPLESDHYSDKGAAANAIRRRLYARQLHDLRQAAALLANSDYTRRVVTTRLGIAPARVHVTPLGVSDRFTPPDASERSRVRRRWALPEPYLLYVGGVEHNKNLPALLRAFSEASRDLPIHLLLVGPDFMRADKPEVRRLHAILDTLPRSERIVLRDYAPESDLPALYAGALAVVAPSAHEGFGLPALEALACGAAVIANDIPVYRETIGEAAILIPIVEARRLHDACQHLLLHEDDLGRRERGVAVAARYSWRRTVAETLSVLKTVARGVSEENGASVGP